MKKTFLIFTIIILLISSCKHRFSPRLYQIDGESKIELNRESSYYIKNMVFSPEVNGEPIKPGDGQVLATRQTVIDPDNRRIMSGLIATLKEIEYRLYVELPELMMVDSIDIAGKSICRVIGMYERSEDLWNYQCREGYLLIDTVKSSRFHAWLNGKYYNIENDSLIFDGSLNVKLKK